MIDKQTVFERMERVCTLPIASLWASHKDQYTFCLSLMNLSEKVDGIAFCQGMVEILSGRLREIVRTGTSFYTHNQDLSNVYIGDTLKFRSKLYRVSKNDTIIGILRAYPIESHYGVQCGPNITIKYA